jgi:hypothetical protein
MKKRLGEEKGKNCSPITKEREAKEENNLHWFQEITKKFKEEFLLKKCIHEKWKDG